MCLQDTVVTVTLLRSSRSRPPCVSITLWMILAPKMSPRCLFSSKNVSKLTIFIGEPTLQALAVTALRSRLHQIWLQRGAYLASIVSPSYGRNFTAVQSRPPCGWYWLRKCLQGAFLAPKMSPSSLIFTGKFILQAVSGPSLLSRLHQIWLQQGAYLAPNMPLTRCILSSQCVSKLRQCDPDSTSI